MNVLKTYYIKLKNGYCNEVIPFPTAIKSHDKIAISAGLYLHEFYSFKQDRTWNVKMCFYNDIDCNDHLFTKTVNVKLTASIDRKGNNGGVIHSSQFITNSKANVGELVKCPWCGCKFNKLKKSQKFHSIKCKDYYWNNARKKRS